MSRRTSPLLWPLLLACLCTTAQADDPSPTLEVVAEIDYAPGNIAVAPDGSVFVSLHTSMQAPFVALAIENGKATPFPPDGWATPLGNEAASERGLHSVLGIRADAQDQVWMLSGGSGQAVKHLYVWNRKDGRLVQDYRFEGPPAAASRSFFNDIALAPRHGKVFISDPADGEHAAIVVVDLKTGTGMRKLEGHASVQAEAVTAHVAGKVLGSVNAAGEAVPLRSGINPITIDPDEQWVYYGAMSGKSVYRVPVADLLDDTLTNEALASRVERYADKDISAGITIDNAGNVYVADIQANGVGVATPGQPYRVLVQDDVHLSWPDGLSVGADGYVYVNANSLFRTMGSHRADGPPTAPFYLTRFKALAPTTAGR
ncbi:MAG TPA: L-dopachrome tautomerase-related protein [Hyphomicrobiales bacterium]|nr:L-dopachrome tautomerase-related protein [Hyphomicrobiales bacterium]